MSYTVIFPTPLRKITNTDQIVLEHKGQTIGEVIQALDSHYPGFRGRICEENQSLRRFINIYVNGEDIRFLEHLSTQVNDGALVDIVLAVAGG